jgi:hypothetical protein
MAALSKKLIIRPATKWLIYNAPKGYTNSLLPLPEGVIIHTEPTGDYDGLQFFTKNSTELVTQLNTLAKLITKDNIAWISYPKKSSGVSTDLSMTGNWDKLDEYHLEVVASAAIDETWTALRLRPIGVAKKSNAANADIMQNEYSAYIDVEAKIVKLPADVSEALALQPVALTYYNTLSYSHRKEYVLWIISARQQKTRAERVSKMIEKLLSKKKNPTEK